MAGGQVSCYFGPHRHSNKRLILQACNICFLVGRSMGGFKLTLRAKSGEQWRADSLQGAIDRVATRSVQSALPRAPVRRKAAIVGPLGRRCASGPLAADRGYIAHLLLCIVYLKMGQTSGNLPSPKPYIKTCVYLSYESLSFPSLSVKNQRE